MPASGTGVLISRRPVAIDPTAGLLRSVISTLATAPRDYVRIVTCFIKYAHGYHNKGATVSVQSRYGVYRVTLVDKGNLRGGDHS